MDSSFSYDLIKQDLTKEQSDVNKKSPYNGDRPLIKDLQNKHVKQLIT